MAAGLLLLAATAAAQTPPAGAPHDQAGTTVVTLLTASPETHIKLRGRGALQGRSPLDLPPWINGRYSVVARGEDVAQTQGVLTLSGRSGEHALLISEPPGLSAGLVVRSLNFPGMPDVTARRTQRGLALATAATGAVFAGVRAHLRYRDRLDEFGDLASRRAQDERSARSDWITYGAAVWTLSAVDYWIRPRLDIQESTPTHVLLSVPRIGRSQILWRSLLVPGAGQDFSNHEIRGTVWLAAFLGAGAGFTMAEVALKRDQTDLDWARAQVDSAGPSERPARLREVAVRQNDLQSSEDVRRGFRTAAIAIYAANVIDAMLVPIRRNQEAPPPRVSAAFPVGRDHAGFALTYRF
jgi:hypothetical protein